MNANQDEQYNPTPEQIQQMLEMQRIAMIEAFRQNVASTCAVAMCIKIDDEHINAKDVAKRAKKVADCLTAEMFGE